MINKHLYTLGYSRFSVVSVLFLSFTILVFLLFLLFELIYLSVLYTYTYLHIHMCISTCVFFVCMYALRHVRHCSFLVNSLLLAYHFVVTVFFCCCLCYCSFCFVFIFVSVSVIVVCVVLWLLLQYFCIVFCLSFWEQSP